MRNLRFLKFLYCMIFLLMFAETAFAGTAQNLQKASDEAVKETDVVLYGDICKYIKSTYDEAVKETDVVLYGDICKYIKSTYRVCAGEFQGRVVYIVTWKACNSANGDWWATSSDAFDNLGDARSYRDRVTAREYSSCLTSAKIRDAQQTWDKIIWNEIK